MPTVHVVNVHLRRLLACAPRPAVTQCRTQNRFQLRRGIHQLRKLPYDIDKGLGDFLSPEALRMLAVDYQQGLLTRLNEQVKGTGLELQSVTDTVISAAGDRKNALAFNYASQALNNSFFLESLRPPPPPPDTNETDISGELVHCIRLHFGSLQQLKSTFSAAAMGMVNSGWVWLVSDEKGNMEVVATFGAGTLLVRSRSHLRTSELPILGEPYNSRYKGSTLTARKKHVAPQILPTPPDAKEYPDTTIPPYNSSPSPAVAALGSDGSLSQGSTSSDGQIANIYQTKPLTVTSQATADPSSKTNIDDLGDILMPLLCISVQEHAWVGTGYGVWGKEEYLKRFWTVVNWKRVASALDKALALG